MGEETAVAAEASSEPRRSSCSQELIRLDTVNPPGNEERAQEPLAETLPTPASSASCSAAEPGRPNLVADLRGEAAGDRRSACSATSTRSPPIPPSGASSPWSGDVVDGEVRGRGAQDMKGQVAAEVRGRDRARPRRAGGPAPGTLKLVITADEEMGAAARRPVAVRRAPRHGALRLVVNEGGGRLVRARRPALLHPLRRREGRQPLPAARPRRRRARLACRRWATTRC